MVGLIHLDRELDGLGISRLSNLAVNRVCAARCASIVSDNATQGCVGHERQVVRCACDAINRRNQVIETALSQRTARMNRGSGSAESSRNVSRTSRVNPVAQTTEAINGASTVFSRAVIRGAQGGFNVALDFADGLGFSLSNLRRTNGLNGVLKVRHHEVAAELLDVVAETSAATEFVGERCNVSTFGHTGGHRGSEGVNGPFNECRCRLALRSGRKHGSFLGGEDSQDVGQVFTIGDGRTRIGCVESVRKSHVSR